MNRTFDVRRAGVAGVLACLAIALSPLSPTAAHAATDRLRFTFDADGTGKKLSGATVTDSSGLGNNGTVKTAFGGSVDLVMDSSVVADFPGKCGNEPCPNALITVSDRASLDPGLADFEWGARLVLKASETDDGENVLQKGTWGQVGGQWKLQVDKAAGRPSCVVSGKAPGKSERRVVLTASISVADGQWHQVVCRRTANTVAIIVDGVGRGSATMAAVMLDSNAPVTVGAKSFTQRDNDQFHGMVDDVFMTIL